jgi:hypothetical protein
MQRKDAGSTKPNNSTISVDLLPTTQNNPFVIKDIIDRFIDIK